MKEKNASHYLKRPPLNRPDILFLSLFGTGYSPYAPGTVASFASLPFFFILSTLEAPFFFVIPFLATTTVIACYLAHKVQIEFGAHDPSWIVIDEFLGLGVTWLFLKSHHWGHLLLITLLFRFFDIVKIWPANYVDRKIKNGAGTILDDLISGVYAGLCYLAFVKWIPFINP